MVRDKKINIYVLTYNKPVLDRLNDDWHIPLQVGADSSGLDICELKDNTGDNISSLNPFYSELTGIYWVWKNAPKTKYVGFEAYRREFAIDKEVLLNLLEDNEIVLPTPLSLSDETNSEFYARVNIKSDLDTCRDIINEAYPEYSEDFTKRIDEAGLLYYGNGFITTWENFDKIATFIFGILDEYKKRNGFKTLDDIRAYVEKSGQTMCPLDHQRDGMSSIDYQMKIGAFLAERLLTLYTYHNFKNPYKVKYNELETEYRVTNMKVLLCTIGRLENRYIRDFVEYYGILGVDNICLYDNNRDGEEDFHDAIGDYIDNGFVILKDYRNKTVCQMDAYNECYKEYGDKYDWIMFFDVDEFMFVNGARNVKEYLADRVFDPYDMIHVNWLNFGDNDKLSDEGGHIIKRLPKPLDYNHKTNYNFPDDFHIKSIVRGRLNRVEWKTTVHTPSIDGQCCNSFGDPCDKDSPFVPYDFRRAGLRHYTTKTAEEYAEKVLKGFPDGNPIKKEELLKLFFKRNKVTEEKVNIFKEKLGIDMSYLLPHEFTVEKSKDVQIYSLCYTKKDFQFLDDKVITPLQVGAANNTDVCSLKDNTGDNISGLNYFFIENTGTYWIWKNVKDAKIKGQMQYRRPLEGVDENMDFDKIFSEYDVITCEPFHHPDHKTPTKDNPMVIPADTVEQGYAFSNCGDDLFILEMAIKSKYPEYAEDYDKYIKNGPDLFYSNGFIMKAEDYDRYSAFLFDCLNTYLEMADIHNPKDLIEHVKYNIEVGKYPRYTDTRNVPPEAIKWQTEIGGFLSERVWTLWVQHNFKPERIYKLPYIKMEANMFT